MHGPPRPECTSLLNGPVYSVVKIVRMEIRHYLQCPILWQLAREALCISEDYLSLGHRLCFIACSFDKLRLLAYSHVFYHSLKNDNECVNAFGLIKDLHFIQQKNSNLVKALRPLVT